MHPNPECIYENENGDKLSEDEEDCLEEYKLKGLIKESAAFECPSPDHNKMSPAILSTVFNFSIGAYENDVTVIPDGVVVMTYGTRCDGKIDCWNGEDEDMCGFNTFVTFGAGNVSNSQYFFSNLNYNCSNLSYMRNLQEQVKKAFCYQKFL